MKSIKEVSKKFKSIYAFAKANRNTSDIQIRKLIKAGAKVDETGQVWIKSKTKLEVY